MGRSSLSIFWQVLRRWPSNLHRGFGEMDVVLGRCDMHVDIKHTDTLTLCRLRAPTGREEGVVLRSGEVC